MSHNYKASEAERRTRLKALETAVHHVSRNYIDRDQKMIAAAELLGYRTIDPEATAAARKVDPEAKEVSYGVFTAAQVAGWLGLSPWALEGNGSAKAWGVSALTHEQLPIAVELAKAGLKGERPKALILKAHREYEMSFNVIGGLIGVHKNVVSRVIKRLEGEPWT